MTKDFKKILHDMGYKVTPARLAILEIFSSNHLPMSAEDIANKLQKHKIDMVTVYRTLGAFTESGILKRVDLRKDSVSYELNDSHHHHIVCVKCEKVEDIEECDTEKLVKKIIAKSSRFKTIQDHSLEFFGLCNACAK